MLRGGGPGSSKADDGVIRVVRLPDIEADFGGEGLQLLILQDYELLVGRSLEEEGDAFLFEHGNHVPRAVDCVRSDAPVEIVSEEGVELDAQEAALRQQGAVLLDGGEKVLRRTPGEDYGLSAQGADFGAADVEDVAEILQVRQGVVAFRACEGVAQAGAVYEQRQAVLMGNRLEFSEFRAAVDGPVFGGQGDVDEAGPDHVVLVHVRVAGGEEGFQFAGVHLAQMLGESHDLVAGVLHGAGFMDVDVRGLYGDGAFIVAKQRGDYGGVGLRAAYEEIDLAAGAGTGFQDLPPGALGVRVAAVAVQLFEVGLSEALQDFRVSALGVIASE